MTGFIGDVITLAILAGLIIGADLSMVGLHHWVMRSERRRLEQNSADVRDP